MVAALQEANARLRAENAELKAQIAEQAEQIARLERLISRNSGNSSMPPSSDDLPGKKPPERRAAPGREEAEAWQAARGAGGVPAVERVTRTRPMASSRRAPAGAAADLAGARDLGVRYSHQVTDLPEARAETIQHDRHEVECACGRSPCRGRPAGGRGRAGHRDVRAELPGLVRVLDGDAPRPGRAVRGHPRVDVRHPAFRRVGARPAGPRGGGGRGGEQDHPGADHPGPRGLRRRDAHPGRPGPEDQARGTCRSPAPACSRITSSAAGTCPPSRTSSTATCTAP